MKVKEVMTTNVISVEPKTSIEKVAHTITEHNIHAVPVIERGELAGIITEKDFFIKNSKFYLPLLIDFLKKGGDKKGIFGKKKDDVETLVNARARDIMTKNCVAVDPELEINELIDLFKKTNFITFPVTDKRNKIVGIVTLHDIIQLF